MALTVWSSFGFDPSEPMPDLALTFGTEPLVGWRVWNLNTYQRRGCDPEPRLGPIGVSGYPWHPGRRMEAVCDQGRHDAPWLTCMCGLWALRTREEAEKLAAGHRPFGAVYLWGRVLEFEKGYRAQYAYPRELFMYGDAPAGLADLYRVPVKVLAKPEPLKIDDGVFAIPPGSLLQFITTNVTTFPASHYTKINWLGFDDPPSVPTTTGRKAFDRANLKALRDAEAKKRGRRK